MLNIEQKEDSAEKLAAIAGKPTKNFLFAEEVNQIVTEVNNLEATINPDRLISLGTETIDVNEYTYEGYTWQLDGVQINNIGNPSIIVIPSATIGYKRNDISVFKADGTIERIAGTETNGEVVTTPDVPEGTLFYKSYSVNGNDIEAEPEPPAIDGTIYKKKIENTRWKSTQSGSNVVIPFQAAGQSHYSVVHSGLVSVAGFSNALLTTPMYEGQDVLFENQTGNSITLKDMFGSTPVRFNLGADLLVPNGGKIWFRFRNDELELIMKSWQQNDIFSINWSSTFNPAASVNWFRMVRSVGGWFSNSFEVESIATFNPNLGLYAFDSRVPKHLVGSNSKAIEATVSVNLNSNGETIRILCLAFKINPTNGAIYNQTPIFDTTIVNALGVYTTVVHPTVDTNHLFSKGDFVTFFIFNNNTAVTGRTIFANLQLTKI